MAGAGTVTADGADRAGRVFAPADHLSVTAQQLVGALAGGHRRGQLLAGQGLSLPVAGGAGARRVAEAQPGKYPQPVGIQGKNGPGPGEQVNAVGSGPADARVDAPGRPRNRELSAPAEPLGSFRRPAAGAAAAQRIPGAARICSGASPTTLRSV